MRAIITVFAFILLTGCMRQGIAASSDETTCAVELVVLGVAQDAGAPQIGNPDDPAWKDPSLRRLATSLAILDRRAGTRFLFDATPDLREQTQYLDSVVPPQRGKKIFDGVFLTHAHIGHYAGLMFLGHESAGASGVTVYAMPRMAMYLSSNGPWDQLVSYNNITLRSLAADVSTSIGDELMVTPVLVPHRDEYSETVGFTIEGPDYSALFLPDIDSWDRWESEFGVRINDKLGDVDVAYVDATFYDDNELPGRDMSAIPHPRIARSMERFSALPQADRSKVRFIHLNHTNPARFPGSEARLAIDAAGFRVAERNEVFCLQRLN